MKECLEEEEEGGLDGERKHSAAKVRQEVVR